MSDQGPTIPAGGVVGREPVAMCFISGLFLGLIIGVVAGFIVG